MSANQSELCASGEPNAFESTSCGGMQTSESTAWLSQEGISNSDMDMNIFNQALGPMPWQSYIQDLVIGMPSTMDDLAAAEAPPRKPRPLARRSQNPTSRSRKSRMRLSSQRSSSPVHNKHAQAKDSHAQSNESSQVQLKMHPKVDPQEAIALLEASIQPFSTFSQLKVADLISQMKQLVIEEQKYGRGSQSGTSDVVTTATAPSSQNSISNAESVESECLTDNTSVSSTLRQPPTDGENTNDSMSTSESQIDVKHEPCKHCGVKALLQCTSKDCGYSTHSFADYKRHESGEKHWPQERFMCLECVDHSFSATNHGPSCTFCRVPFSALGTNIPHHQYVQSRVQCRAARREVTTFSRKDHLIDHLRKDHNMLNMNDTIDTWKFGIESDWPRQCGFCGTIFRTWNERMSHLKREFEAGKDMSKWKLPFPKSMDFRPSGLTLPKDDDDDDDQDDSFGGNSGSWAKPASKAHTQPRTKSQTNSSRSNVSKKNSSQQRYQKADASMKFTSADDSGSRLSIAGKTSITLQRYLNDMEEPVPARLNLGKSEALNIALVSMEKEAVSSTSSDRSSVTLDLFCRDGRHQEHICRSHEMVVNNTPEVSSHDIGECQPALRSASASVAINSPSHASDIEPVPGLFRRISYIRQRKRMFRKTEATGSARYLASDGSADTGGAEAAQSLSHLERSQGKYPRDHPATIQKALHLPQELLPEHPRDPSLASDHARSFFESEKSISLQDLDGVLCCYELPGVEASSIYIENDIPKLATSTTSDCLTLQTGDLIRDGTKLRICDSAEGGSLPHIQDPALSGRSSTTLEDIIDVHRRRAAIDLGSINCNSSGSNSQTYIPCGPTKQDVKNETSSLDPAITEKDSALGLWFMETPISSAPQRNELFQGHVISVHDEHEGPFVCVFDFVGCTSTFLSKNEWKSHVMKQHMDSDMLARDYGKNRHTFARYSGPVSYPSSRGLDSTSGKSFNRADVFRRQHAAVHIAKSTPPESRGQHSTNTTKILSGCVQGATGNHSTYTGKFSDAQDFYDRLDDCHLPVSHRKPRGSGTASGVERPSFRTRATVLHDALVKQKDEPDLRNLWTSTLPFCWSSHK